MWGSVWVALRGAMWGAMWGAMLGAMWSPIWIAVRETSNLMLMIFYFKLQSLAGL